MNRSIMDYIRNSLWKSRDLFMGMQVHEKSVFWQVVKVFNNLFNWFNSIKQYLCDWLVANPLPWTAITQS